MERLTGERKGERDIESGGTTSSLKGCRDPYTLETFLVFRWSSGTSTDSFLFFTRP